MKILYKRRLVKHPLLAKKMVIIRAICRILQVFRLLFFVYFCVNHPHLVPFYLSSLVVSPLFFTPNYPLLATKMPLFEVHFAPFEPCFSGSKRFCLYHSYEYLCFSPRIQHHFALRLAAKRLAFSTKMHCI